LDIVFYGVAVIELDGYEAGGSRRAQTISFRKQPAVEVVSAEGLKTVFLGGVSCQTAPP